MPRLFCFIILSFLIAAPLHAAPKTTVSVAAPWEISGADPAKNGYIYLRMGVMETLVEADVKGTLQPGLSSRWTVSDDGLTWRFSLREGVQFHDGKNLTADSVVKALQRAKGKPGVLGKAPISEIGADNDAVVFKLGRPFAALAALLAHSSTVIPSPGAFDENGEPVRALGTGPFRVKTLSPPQSLVTARFDNYWGKKPAITGASYLAAGRAETRSLMAESGDADLVFTIDPAGYARLGHVDTVKTVAVAIPRVMALKVNAGHPFLEEEKARRALSLAIDRAGIASGITRFPEARATQLFPPALGNWHNKSLPPLRHDPQTAGNLLAELGWKPGADGILERDGARFELELRTFPDRPEQPLVAAALQDQWRAIGIDLDVVVTNYSEIPAGHKDGTLELGLLARNYGLTPDPIGTVLSDFSEGGGDWGATNWNSPKTHKAVQDIAATADPGKRSSLIAMVSKTLQEELPMIPIIWHQHTAAIAKGLNGVVVDPFERTYGLSEVSWSD